ncbi:phage capsid protein [Rubrivivax sp. JA1024]|nr:phage capsid protein [Rubrivivax sp. JA1024]
MGPITDSHKLAYQANTELAVQQLTSKFDAGFTYISGLSGRQAMMLELFGTMTAVINLGRKADTPDQSANIEPIWVQPIQMANGALMELEDAIKAMTDHQSDFIKAMAASMVRGKDQILSAAVFGTRKIGQDGTTVSSWNGSTVAAGVGYSATDDTTACGMNVKKLLRARRYLQQAQVDLGSEQLFWSGNAQEQEELFRDLTFISEDYRNVKPLDQPQNLDILGITVLPPNDGLAAFADADGSTFTSALWAKSGMRWGDFSPLRTEVPLRGDKMNRPHPQMEQWLGATRTEDAKVVKILTKK